MPPTSNDLFTSTKWDGSNETHNDYKIWMNKVSLWANTNDMAWIMKITKRLRKAPSFRRPGSRVPPIGEKFLDEAQAAAREELLAEIQRSADTDAGADADEQADDVTFDHKMAPSAVPDWDIDDPYDFADEDLASLLRGDGKKKVDLVASMHMLKLKRLAANLGKTAWNDISSLHVPDKAALGVLHSQIMAQELRSLNSKFVSALRNNLFGVKRFWLLPSRVSCVLLCPSLLLLLLLCFILLLVVDLS